MYGLVLHRGADLHNACNVLDLVVMEIPSSRFHISAGDVSFLVRSGRSAGPRAGPLQINPRHGHGAGQDGARRGRRGLCSLFIWFVSAPKQETQQRDAEVQDPVHDPWCFRESKDPAQVHRLDGVDQGFLDNFGRFWRE